MWGKSHECNRLLLEDKYLCSELTPLFLVVCSCTCCGNDAVAALATEAWEQAGLSSACQANAHHIILRSRRWGSFTAQCPETLQRKKKQNVINAIGREIRWEDRVDKRALPLASQQLLQSLRQMLSELCCVFTAPQEDSSHGHHSCLRAMTQQSLKHIKNRSGVQETSSETKCLTVIHQRQRQREREK